MEEHISMTTTNTAGSTVVGVFEDHERARDAIEALKDAGFRADSISVLTPDKRATREIAEDTGSNAAGGAATGALAGGVLGGLGGWLVGIGALAIPGVGPFIAAGAFATALGGAALGAGLGAIAGALIGMGVPEEHAKYYEQEAKAGRTLVTVRANGRYDDAQRILRKFGAYDVESQHAGTTGTRQTAAMGSTSRSSAPASKTTEDRMQLREEELVAKKQTVEKGEVRVSKDVVTEQRTVDVPVRREEVTIERTPVDRRPSDQPIDEREDTISVPVREERVEVEKRPVVYEEVGVGKREVETTQRVSDTVRREEARIEGASDVRGTGWDQVRTDYQKRWQERYGGSGQRWEDAEPAYRYGYEMRDRPEYRGRAWNDVESDFQHDWRQRNPNTPWERAKDFVRDTWESARGR
jgi:uncharacterized protein (TIGR02271 family)